jgi:hypothetical protein
LLIDPSLRTIDRSSDAGLDCARGLRVSLAGTPIYIRPWRHQFCPSCAPAHWAPRRRNAGIFSAVKAQWSGGGTSDAIEKRRVATRRRRSDFSFGSRLRYGVTRCIDLHSLCGAYMPQPAISCFPAENDRKAPVRGAGAKSVASDAWMPAIRAEVKSFANISSGRAKRSGPT